MDPLYIEHGAVTPTRMQVSADYQACKRSNIANT